MKDHARTCASCQAALSSLLGGGLPPPADNRQTTARRDDDPKTPLFLYVPFNAVHAPHQVPAKYTEPYTRLKEPRRTYAGMVAAMDEAIGTILAALDEAKMRQDTLIVFSSDQGLAVGGRHGLMGKQNLYEHFKSPLIVAGPGSVRRTSSTGTSTRACRSSRTCDAYRHSPRRLGS